MISTRMRDEDEDVKYEDHLEDDPWHFYGTREI